MRKYYLRKRNIIFLACLLALPVLFSILIFDILVSVNKMPGWIVALFVFLIFGEIIHFVRMIFSVHLVVSANGITYSLFTRSATGIGPLEVLAWLFRTDPLRSETTTSRKVPNMPTTNSSTTTPMVIAFHGLVPALGAVGVDMS